MPSSAFVPLTPVWADGSAGGTDIDSTDLQQFTDSLGVLNGAYVVLTQSGSTYAQTALLTDTSRPRIFVSTFDPSTVSGVVVTDFDLWVAYS